MAIYLDDLIAYKSLYLLMQRNTSINLEGELAELKTAAEERCKKYNGYSMVQAQEKREETSLAPITEEIKIIRKIKNMLGHVRMFFAKNKSENIEQEDSEIPQQEAMIKFQLEEYEKTIFVPNQIKEVLGRDVIMKILGMDLNEFMKDNNKSPERKTIREEYKDKPIMEH